MNETIRDLRVRELNDHPIRSDGAYVLYWMVAARRSSWNDALDRAIDHCRELDLPLLVFEPLRIGYRWACDRFHQFVIEGMQDNAEAFQSADVRYLSYVEPNANAAKGLLKTISERAALVVTDDFPCFMLPRMVDAAANQLDCRFEAVDNNGVFPMRATDRVFSRAYDFRRYLQKTLPPFLEQNPSPAPLRRLAGVPKAKVAAEVLRDWPGLYDGAPKDTAAVVAELDIDHEVAAIKTRGGRQRALDLLRRFFEQGLPAYDDLRNQPQKEVASGLSPFLHFGHIGGAEIVHKLLKKENWDPSKLSSTTRGQREGWWGCSPSAEGFLDQVVTWRELGYNMTSKRDDYDQFESLPDWALKTMREHEDDTRSPKYDLATLESAQTYDSLWNAAQTELEREGRIHNYLRMLWGKKILEWSSSPKQALEIMIELNNKYGLDGRNPNSYSGIFWVLGRYDRAWGPERDIFGKIRYMSSDNTARKVRVKDYIAQYSHQGSLFGQGES